jgi:hypothetical protein
VWFLHTASGWGGFTRSFGCELLAWGFTTGGFACGLLCAGHFVYLFLNMYLYYVLVAFFNSFYSTIPLVAIS